MSQFSGFDSTFFEVRQEPEAAILTMTREQLTEDENLEQFDEDLISLVDTYQVRRIVIDLASVGYLTSSAIGKLIALHRRLARQNGRLVLCSLHPEVEHILKTSHLLDYFSIAPTCEDAQARMTNA
jgi:anti-anti-sigma factor